MSLTSLTYSSYNLQLVLGDFVNQPLRTIPLNQAVREYIKNYIVDNKLNAGDILPTEAELAEELGVGRGSVREAVKSLVSLGILEIQRGKGTFVREYNLDPVRETFHYGIQLNPKTLHELLNIRLWLELAIIEDVIAKISPRDIEKLEGILEEWQTRVTEGETAFSDLDSAFHRTLLQPLENEMLLRLSTVFWSFSDKLRESRRVQHFPSGDKIVADHRAILDAIKGQDIELAQASLRQSYAFALEWLERPFE